MCKRNGGGGIVGTGREVASEKRIAFKSMLVFVPVGNADQPLAGKTEITLWASDASVGGFHLAWVCHGWICWIGRGGGVSYTARESVVVHM